MTATAECFAQDRLGLTMEEMSLLEVMVIEGSPRLWNSADEAAALAQEWLHLQDRAKGCVDDADRQAVEEQARVTMETSEARFAESVTQLLEENAMDKWCEAFQHLVTFLCGKDFPVSAVASPHYCTSDSNHMAWTGQPRRSLALGDYRSS